MSFGNGSRIQNNFAPNLLTAPGWYIGNTTDINNLSVRVGAETELDSIGVPTHTSIQTAFTPDTVCSVLILIARPQPWLRGLSVASVGNR